VRCQVTKTYPLDQLRYDPFGIDHGFKCGVLAMQVRFVDSPEGMHMGPERCACPLSRVAVTRVAAVRQDVGLRPEESALTATTVRACEPI
jgi:hypothetical protein